MDKNDYFIKTQIESDLSRLIILVNTGVFNAEVLRVFQESVFTEIIIKLNDLLQKLRTLGKRLDFKEDVEKANDITDLISNIRNAVCHMDSDEHMLDTEGKIKFSFNIAYGKGNLLSLGARELTADYKDDICFFFGENKVYLKRHIIRCIEETKQEVKELYENGFKPQL